ncbi:MAG: PAS domain-containing protein, partial [Rhizobiales bacterium]|nr:PAS domain-containing protein [Hyphomicrobiales bacterium]
MTVDLTDKLMQQAKIRVRDGFIAIAVFLVLLLTLRIGHEASLQYFAAEQRDELLLADEVVKLDGEIMESIRMIIQTNDPAWYEAYKSRSSTIANTANSLVGIASEPAKSNFLHAMPKALSVQTALHKKIFALVDRGEVETANELLAGQQYKQARSNVLGTFFTLEKEIETNLQQKQSTETFFANGLTLLLIVIGVGLIHRRQQHLLEEDKKQFSIIAEDLRHLNEENAVLETISIDQQQQITELAAVAEKTSNVVILHDADQKVRWVNKAFSNLTGLTLSDIAGRSFPMEPIQKQNVEEVLAGAAPTVDHVDGEDLACPDISSRFDSVISSADSSPIWLDVDRQVFKDASGHITGYITVGTN